MRRQRSYRDHLNTRLANDLGFVSTPLTAADEFRQELNEQSRERHVKAEREHHEAIERARRERAEGTTLGIDTTSQGTSARATKLGWLARLARVLCLGRGQRARPTCRQNGKVLPMGVAPKAGL